MKLSSLLSPSRHCFQCLKSSTSIVYHNFDRHFNVNITTNVNNKNNIDNKINSRQKPLSIIFYGSTDFSLPTVKLLYENSKLTTKTKIVNEIDVVSGSQQNVVANFAKENHITTFDWPHEVEIGRYDVGVVVSFGHLIPVDAIDACKFGMVNVHASLLPKWRGAAPIQRAILNRDTKTGVTIMKIRPEKFDVGEIILQKEIEMPLRPTTKTLLSQLSEIGADLLLQCLTNLEYNLSQAKPQPSCGITRARKVKPEEGHINWSTMDCEKVDCLFRAFDGFIDVYTSWIDGCQLRLYDMCDPHVVRELKLDSLVGKTNVKPGFVYYHKKRRIMCIKCFGDTWSAFGSVSLKGRKRMTAMQFYNGFITKVPPNSEIILGETL